MKTQPARHVLVSLAVLCCSARPVFAQGSERVVDDMMDAFSIVVATILAVGVGIAAFAASRGRASSEFLVTLTILSLIILGLMAWQVDLSILWPTFVAMAVTTGATILSLWSRAKRRRRT
ncbi:MAG: hypothetical protein HS111_06765 [Kofleriaceae bacterium]|nr:hypothetical protein [Kofleriaceae bacterium]